MAYARKPLGKVVPRADYSVGGVQVVEGGEFGYHDLETHEIHRRGAEYMPLRFDEACRCEAFEQRGGPVDRRRSFAWVPRAELAAVEQEPGSEPGTGPLGPPLARGLFEGKAGWARDHAERLGILAREPSKL